LASKESRYLSVLGLWTESLLAQVETLGDNVYMVAGGVPDRRSNHAENMAAVALEFRAKVKQIKVPDTERILIRIGN